jgi:Flp pilus assembly pilin Flp
VHLIVPSRSIIIILALFIELFNNEDGETAIEYGLIAALIALPAVAVMGTTGTNLSSTLNSVANFM